MTPQELQLFNELLKKFNDFYYPDRYQFPRSIRHMGPQLGFYGKPLINQPSSTGTNSGFNAGVGATMHLDATATGGIGSTAYNYGDTVKHLKELGLMAM